MGKERFEAVVIGCGVAGLSIAEAGARVAVLEGAAPKERGGQGRYTEAYLRTKSKADVTDDLEHTSPRTAAAPSTPT